MFLLKTRIIFVPPQNMKKGIASILLLLYVAFSTGVVISYHYCMNDLDSLQLGAVKTEVCGKCGMDVADANGCCHDQVKIFKIQDDQQIAGLNFKFSAPVITIDALPNFDHVLLVKSTHSYSLNNHSPPVSRQDTYLQNCVFRI